jgi:cytochrome c peroxidase
MQIGHFLWLVGTGLLTLAGATLTLATEPQVLPGENPNPVHLVRPRVAPLSAMARLGQQIFYDTSFSSSGRLSCASCHSPQRAYGPPNDGPVMLGGPDLSRQGVRAVPSLEYLERQPPFSIGPDDPNLENVNMMQMAALGQTAVRAQKIATSAQAAANIVPQGGLFWDGRASTFQDQAIAPLLNPLEIDGGSVEKLVAKLHQASYSTLLTALFGQGLFDNPKLLVAEAMFAVGRYQVEEPSFHPYTSKFDDWLEGKVRLNAAEMRGYSLFNDPKKANCGGCHLDQPSRDGLPPLFTDHQYEALGAPRNFALAVNKDPNFFDLGICGPYRSDMATQTQYCGMFLTPTLRNVAMRRAFFHNGVFATLQQVLDFYNFRDTDPQKVYPRGSNGVAQKYDDVPDRFQTNVDVVDPPFDRHFGESPAMTAQDETDIIAFLQTLTDGYKPDK